MVPLSALSEIEYNSIDTRCSDLSDSCAVWAASGECTNENSYTVMKTCPASCRVCTRGCSDQTSACRGWAIDGQCKDNHEFMFRECPLSCGLCVVTCLDKMSKEICEFGKQMGGVTTITLSTECALKPARCALPLAKTPATTALSGPGRASVIRTHRSCYVTAQVLATCVQKHARTRTIHNVKSGIPANASKTLRRCTETVRVHAAFVTNRASTKTSHVTHGQHRVTAKIILSS